MGSSAFHHSNLRYKILINDIATTCRYLQKRNLIKQKEDRERAEQEQYELQLKEKFMRVCSVSVHAH